MILPQIEEQPVYDLYWTLPDQVFKDVRPAPNGPIGNDDRLRKARHTRIELFYCPTGNAPQPNEMDTDAFGFWRGSYLGCVGAGDMYGNKIFVADGPVPNGSWVGVFAVKRHGGGKVTTDYTDLTMSSVNQARPAGSYPTVLLPCRLTIRRARCMSARS